MRDIIQLFISLKKVFKEHTESFITLIFLILFLVYLFFYILLIPSLKAKIDLQEERIKFLHERIEFYKNRTFLDPVIKKKKEEMKNYKSKEIDVEKLDNDEVIKDLRGSYYVIDIKDAYTEKIINFEVGEYTIEDFFKKYGNSISVFQGVIIDEFIKKGISYQIFVKGSADYLGHESFKGRFNPFIKFEKIEYYRKFNEDGKSKFLPIPKMDIVEEPIRNKNLPNLRAAFIKEMFEKKYGDLGEVIILAGDVELEFGARYRTATLILWVNWPDFK